MTTQLTPLVNPPPADDVTSALLILAHAASLLAPGCSGVGVTVDLGTGPATVVATNEDSRRRDEIQYLGGGGPCLHALRTGEVVLVGDVRQESRWRSTLDEVLLLDVRSILSLPLVAGGSTFGALNIYAPKPGAFTPEVIAAVLPLAHQSAAVLEFERSSTSTSNPRVTHSQLLETVTHDLSSTLDVRAVARHLSLFMVPALADWCMVTLVEPDASMVDVGQWHADPARRELLDTYAATRQASLEGESELLETLRQGIPASVPHNASATLAGLHDPGATQDMVLTLNPSSLMVLPMKAEGVVVGFLLLCNDGVRVPINEDEASVAQEVAMRAALAFRNARLHESLRGAAEVLQRAMLPDLFSTSMLEVATRYVPAALAAQVGGDWYDSFETSSSHVLVMGDVMGHDVAAAAAMGQVRTMVRTLALDDPRGPGSVLTRASHVLFSMGLDTYATTLVAQLTAAQDGWLLRWANAGHLSPMVLQGTSASVLRAESDQLLGAQDQVVYRENEALLEHGATVLLYTDGLVERRDEDIDTGLERLRSALETGSGLSLNSLCDKLLEVVPHDGMADDVAVLAVRLR
jgi:serine phosphatase RsbU (regulator of sigma subunit)